MYLSRKSYQSGNVSLAILIFLALFAIIAWPITKTEVSPFTPTGDASPDGGCVPFTGSNPPTINLAGNAVGDGLAHNASDVYKNATQAKLVISNVYIKVEGLDKQAKQFIDKGDNRAVLSSDRTITVNNQPYLILYPTNHVEINDTHKSAVSFGLVFLAKIDGTGNLIIKTVDIKNHAMKLNQGDYMLTDVYQIPGPAPVAQEIVASCVRAGELVDPALAATASAATQGPPEMTVTFPEQNISQDKKQLQLQWFLFETPPQATAAAGFWSLHCKPAIYLYPKQEMAVNVQVNTRGILTYTDPKYPAGGWDVLAEPSGKLEIRNPKSETAYDYLYYESRVPDALIEKPKAGYVVPFSNLAALLPEYLHNLGLNDQQTADFIAYWTKVLPYSPYYFVGAMSQDNINSIEPLDITPKPDFMNRVRIYFQMLNKPERAELPNLVASRKSPESSNFSVVEWGGMIKLNTGSTFTCSQ